MAAVSCSDTRSVKRTVSSLRLSRARRAYQPIDTQAPLLSTAPLQLPLWCYA